MRGCTFSVSATSRSGFSNLAMKNIAKRLLRFDSKQSRPSAAEAQPSRIISRKDAKAAKFGDYG